MHLQATKQPRATPATFQPYIPAPAYNPLTSVKKLEVPALPAHAPADHWSAPSQQLPPNRQHSNIPQPPPQEPDPLYESRIPALAAFKPRVQPAQQNAPQGWGDWDEAPKAVPPPRQYLPTPASLAAQPEVYKPRVFGGGLAKNPSAEPGDRVPQSGLWQQQEPPAVLHGVPRGSLQESHVPSYALRGDIERQNSQTYGHNQQAQFAGRADFRLGLAS